MFIQIFILPRQL